MTSAELNKKLNAPTAGERLRALRLISKHTAFPPLSGKTTGHIHTRYSFSPYSPSSAAFFARLAGCSAAGITDHETAAGTREFFEAGRVLEIKTGSGIECRVSMAGTPFELVHTNNPDQAGISYMTLHGLSLESADELTRFFEPYRESRLKREKAMTDRIRLLFPETGITFEDDVIPLSLYREGGTVTERHILFALAGKLISAYGRGNKLAGRLHSLSVSLTEKQIKRLLDTEYPYYEYDVMHILKGSFLEKVYIQASDECMALSELVFLSRKVGAICCYAYLGDVAGSVTEDKAPGAFEDSYLNKLLHFLKEAGVDAVTHSKTRNTAGQTAGLLKLCNKLGLETIEGEDINSPRQSFAP